MKFINERQCHIIFWTFYSVLINAFFFFISIKVVFVLASNHFRKCFSVNAGVWLRMENKFFRKYFQLTMCFSWFDPEMVWSENFHFKPFPDSRAKREREREENITPSTSTSHRSHPRIALRRHRSHRSHRDGTDRTEIAPHSRTETAPIALRSHRSLSFPIWCRRPPLTEFDEFFLVGFCFCVYLLRNCIIYLFGSWENMRKIWGTSRKCVFYIIFSNTIKH